MANELIRKALEKYGVRQWELAEAYKLNEWSFSRMMRREIDPGIQYRLLEIIKQVAVSKEDQA